MNLMSRRRVLGLVGGAGLAIASGVVYAAPDGLPFVMLNNRTDRDQAITVTLEGVESETTLVDTTVTVSADESRAVSDVPTGEPVVATVSAERGPENSIRWDQVDDEHALSVGIKPEEIGFEVASEP